MSGAAAKKASDTSGGPVGMNKVQFGNFCKEIGVCNPGKDAYFQSCVERSGAKPLTTSEIDLLFQRANMTNLQRTKREGKETTELGVNAEAFMEALGERGA